MTLDILVFTLRIPILPLRIRIRSQSYMVKAVTTGKVPEKRRSLKKKKKIPSCERQSLTSIIRKDFYEPSVTQDVFYKRARR